MTISYRRYFRARVTARAVLASLLSCAASFLCGGAGPAVAQSSAQTADASKMPLSISVFISSRKDLCYDNGDVAAITSLVTAEQHRINAAGGVRGRPLSVNILDDGRQAQQTVTNLGKALANPATVAMIGITNSANAKVTFDQLGNQIATSAIPFFTDITLNSIFEKHPNVYTIRPSQDEERVPAIVEFIKSRGITRPAFVGISDNPFSASLAESLTKIGGEVKLVADHRFVLKDDKVDPAAIAAVAADLKQRGTEIVFLAIGAARTVPLIEAMKQAGIAPPLFLSGSIEQLREALGREYPGDVFQLAWDDLPDLFSERLRERINRNGLEKWMFEGGKVQEAPGWKSGDCKTRSDEVMPSVYDRRNMRAIGRGTAYADMVALVAEALESADPRADVVRLRAHLLRQLETGYAAGRGAFKGSFENWSFRPNTRSADRTPYVIVRPNGLGASQLAPEQFVRLRSDRLRRVDTLYLDLNLIRTYRVDDNEKSFYADFYLQMRGASADLKKIEFANAFLDPKTNDRQINVRPIHDGSPSDIYPDQMKIFLISGKFIFEPKFANFPFDTQRFAVNIQPKSGDTPFIVQPPPASLRDKTAGTDGWDMKEQYVGYDADFIPTIDAWTHKQSIVPFYKASYVWMMKRQTTDYYLRVVVPLAFILVVAYLAIFIPQHHFEAVVTIQVTALLSAVALYLSLPKIDGDGATMSDRIFIFIYMSVSLMIGISILRISHVGTHTRWLRSSIRIIHVLLIPALVASMAMFVYRASIVGG